MGVKGLPDLDGMIALIVQELKEELNNLTEDPGVPH